MTVPCCIVGGSIRKASLEKFDAAQDSSRDPETQTKTRPRPIEDDSGAPYLRDERKWGTWERTEMNRRAANDAFIHRCCLMLLFPLLGLSLLVAPWRHASAFRPRVPLPQQCSARDRRKHDRRRSACSAPRAAAGADATTENEPCRPQPPRSPFPQPGGSRRSPGKLPEASGIVTHSSRMHTTGRNKKCGAISSLTRSQLLSSAASALAAAVLLGPRRVSAADSTDDAGSSAAAEVVESTGALGTQDLVGEAKYTVGSDEASRVGQ